MPVAWYYTSTVTVPISPPPKQEAELVVISFWATHQLTQTNRLLPISRVLPVYVSHIRGHHHLKISGAILVTIWKGRVQEAVSYYLGDVIIVSQTRNKFILLPLGFRIAPNVKNRVQFPRNLEGYHGSEGSIVHI